MKQFIRYLYEYEQGRRTRNVGFVKVEQDDMETTIHIHAKGLWTAGGEGFKVYLLYEEEGDIFAIPQGEIAYMGPGLNYRLRYTNEDTGTPENYDDIGGILLESLDGRRFSAVWDDDLGSMENVRLWPSDTDMPEEEPERIPEEEPPREEAVEPEEEPPQEETREEEDIVPEEEPPREEAVEPEEEPLQEEAMPPEQVGAEAQAQADMRPSRWKATKIQRNEISILPRCEWRLANNNFLLHGYYNYHHLVLLDDGRRLKLGVPGIYHEREAKAAESFGFPEFIEASETGLSLGEEECGGDGQFGYWCRQVKKPQM